MRGRIPTAYATTVVALALVGGLPIAAARAEPAAIGVYGRWFAARSVVWDHRETSRP